MKNRFYGFKQHLKKALFVVLSGLMFIMPVSAAAAPTATPAESSPTPTTEILKAGSRGLVVLRLQLRLRELNYLNFSPTSSYGTMTRQAVVDFQLTNELTSDGTVGPQTASVIYDIDAKRAQITGNVKLNGPGVKVTTQEGEKISWESAKYIIANGTTVTVTDFNTGSSIQMKRTGGEGCAFMETVSNEDYTKLNTAFANGSWEKRPVIVEIGNMRYGASMSGAPYGTSTGLSDMKGHVELFFDGSTSGILGLSDIDHQRMIAIACGS